MPLAIHVFELHTHLRQVVHLLTHEEFSIQDLILLNWILFAMAS